MLQTIMELSDGTQLSSGAGVGNVIQSLTVTQCVNAGQELTLGSCCANMVEVSLLTPGGDLSVEAGQELTLYRVSEDGIRHKVGIFLAEKPERPTANTMRITAYDRVTRLDRDLTRWLAGLDAWPYSLQEFARMVCGECGLTLVDADIPNGAYAVAKFSGEGITGRQLLQWIGEVAGRFCRATPEGELEFAWYTPLTDPDIGIRPHEGNGFHWMYGDLTVISRELTVHDDGEGNLTVTDPALTVTDDGQGNVALFLEKGTRTAMYYQNSLSFADYTVAPIRRVQLRQNEEDVGTVYPDGVSGAVNTYTVTANPLLTATDAQALQGIAQTLYEQLKEVSYTPCKVSVPADVHIDAGHIVQITDRNNKTVTAYVMCKTQKGQKDTLECTGSALRESTTAVNNRSLQALNGKVLKLKTDVEGIRLEKSDSTGMIADLELHVERILGKVEGQSITSQDLTRRLTMVEQSAQQVNLSMETIHREGATKLKTAMGYTLDDAGLQIARSGQQMKNLLDNTGLYVTRNDQTILQANDKGVVATDVCVRNYLIVGEHARLEDYATGRTACFWLEG